MFISDILVKNSELNIADPNGIKEPSRDIHSATDSILKLSPASSRSSKKRRLQTDRDEEQSLSVRLQRTYGPEFRQIRHYTYSMEYFTLRILRLLCDYST
jgi:hypothetical protein